MYNNKTQRLNVWAAPDTLWTYFMHIFWTCKNTITNPKQAITGPKGCTYGQHQTNLEQAKRGKKREAGSTKRQQLGGKKKQASKQGCPFVLTTITNFN
jgi:hypothetical protein